MRGGRRGTAVGVVVLRGLPGVLQLSLSAPDRVPEGGSLRAYIGRMLKLPLWGIRRP